jgi:hypothetical protein
MLQLLEKDLEAAAALGRRRRHPRLRLVKP